MAKKKKIGLNPLGGDKVYGNVVNNIKVGDSTVKPSKLASDYDNNALKFISSDSTVSIAPTANAGEIDFTVEGGSGIGTINTVSPDSDGNFDIGTGNGLSITNKAGGVTIYGPSSYVSTVGGFKGTVGVSSPDSSITIGEGTKNDITVQETGMYIYKSINLLDEVIKGCSYNGITYSDFLSASSTSIKTIDFTTGVGNFFSIGGENNNAISNMKHADRTYLRTSVNGNAIGGVMATDGEMTLRLGFTADLNVIHEEFYLNIIRDGGKFTIVASTTSKGDNKIIDNATITTSAQSTMISLPLQSVFTFWGYNYVELGRIRLDNTNSGYSAKAVSTVLSMFTFVNKYMPIPGV
jgi:hypothetical protein